MRPAPRISRTVPTGIRRQNGRLRPKHLAWLRSLGMCICCGAVVLNIEAMHIRAGTDGGTGIKPSDRFALPGCHACHMRQHQIGELAFWAELGIDPLDYSARLWAVTGDDVQGLRTIGRARQAIALHQRAAPQTVA
jgi:hypothetical protein